MKSSLALETTEYKIRTYDGHPEGLTVPSPEADHPRLSPWSAPGEDSTQNIIDATTAD